MKKKMKFLPVLLSALFVFSLAACGGEEKGDAPSSESSTESSAPETPENITLSLNKTALTLVEDEWEKLVATANVSHMVEWSSDNTDVATVSASGKVIAKSAGTAKITAQIKGTTAVCTVTVQAQPPKTADYVLVDSVEYLSMQDENTPQIKPTYMVVADGKEQADHTKTFTFKSMNPDIATVNEEGVITPVSTGTTDIVVSCGDVVTYVAADVYTRIITTASQWLEMISLEDIFARYYLATDIDFTDVTYDVSTNAGVGQGFSGELNGGYHTLSNIKVTGSGKQSLLGGANCAKVKNIAFQGVKYTSNNAGGICDSLVQHKNVSSLEGLTFLGDEVLINGKVIEGAFKSPGMELVVFPAIFSNIILDAQFVGHSNAAFCKDFYGGTVNNVYVNMTHADDEAFSDADFAFCQNLYIWNTPNAVSNVFVYIEKGTMNDTPARLLGSFELPMSNVGYYTDQMQINYQAYKALDASVFDVHPTGIPTFAKKSI